MTVPCLISETPLLVCVSCQEPVWTQAGLCVCHVSAPCCRFQLVCLVVSLGVPSNNSPGPWPVSPLVDDHSSHRHPTHMLKLALASNLRA